MRKIIRYLFIVILAAAVLAAAYYWKKYSAQTDPTNELRSLKDHIVESLSHETSRFSSDGTVPVTSPSSTEEKEKETKPQSSKTPDESQDISEHHAESASEKTSSAFAAEVSDKSASKEKVDRPVSALSDNPQNSEKSSEDLATSSELPVETSGETASRTQSPELSRELEQLRQSKSEARDNRWLLEMKKSIPDLVAWITMPGFGIDHPVVRGTDNSYYLNHDVYKRENYLGSVFMDFEMDPAADHSNVTIYGHHSDTAEMFSGLTALKNKAVFDKPSFVRLDYPDRSVVYEVIGILDMDVSGKNGYFSFNAYSDITTLEDMEVFVQNLKKYALYWKDQPITADDCYLTLSTCSDLSGTARVVVVAKKR